jgi:hypothetical protein
MSVLPYISLFIGICTPLLGIAFGITWVDLHYQLKKSPHLRAQFNTIGKRLCGAIFFAAINIAPSYFPFLFYPGNKNDTEFMIFASAAAFLWYAIGFLATFVELIIEAKRENAKTRT